MWDSKIKEFKISLRPDSVLIFSRQFVRHQTFKVSHGTKYPK